jgi:hypothetical protein
MTRITVALHEDLCTFMIIKIGILLRMRVVLGKSCRDNQNIHFISSTIFLKLVPFKRQRGKIG